MNNKLTLILTLALLILSVSRFSDDTRLTTNLSSATGNAKVITQEPTYSNIATLVIKGVDTAQIGDLVVISVEESNAASFKWMVTPSTDNILVIDGGKRIVFSSGELGEYTFTVACALGDTVDLATHVVKIVPPAKPLSELQSKITSWCELINSSSKRDECLALSQSFSSVAALIEAGNLVTPEDIVAATSLSNKTALGDSLENWQPFRDGLVKHLTEMSEKGELSNPESHTKTWREVAEALRLVAESL